MPLFVWEDSFSVKIPSIDRQHRGLFDVINRIHESQLTGKPVEVVSEVLSPLARYVTEHFEYEQSLFDRYAYPSAVSHKKEHDAFVQSVTLSIKKYREGSLDLASLKSTLIAWWKHHILDSDMKYSEYLTSKGAI